MGLPLWHNHLALPCLSDIHRRYTCRSDIPRSGICQRGRDGQSEQRTDGRTRERVDRDRRSGGGTRFFFCPYFCPFLYPSV